MKMIYEIYFDSVKVLWKYKLLYLIPLANIFLFVFEYRANKYNSGLYSFIISLVTVGVGVVLDLIVILTVFRENGFYPIDTSRWLGVKKFFWRTVGLNIASVFAVLLLSPLCFFLYLLALDELNNVFSILYIFTFVVFMILWFGINFLGIRILVGQDKKIGESMWMGFQTLNSYRSHYFPFIAFSLLVSFFPFLIVNIISFIQVGSTICSVPIIPTDVFHENSLLVYASVPGSYAVLRLYGFLIAPITSAAITLIYLRFLQSQSRSMPIMEIVN